MAIQREKNGHFKKGVSANPGGRPKGVTEIKHKLSGWFDENGWAELKRLAFDEQTPVKTRVALLQWFAEFIYGRPAQMVIQQDLTLPSGFNFSKIEDNNSSDAD